MRGAIVSLSEPNPPASWRWGGPDWKARSAPGLRVVGAVVAARGAAHVAERWTKVLGAAPPGIRFVEDDADPGLTDILIDRDGEVSHLSSTARN
jgi:hypothetical protein